MSAETPVLTPDDYAHWAKIGAEDYTNGRCDRALTCDTWAAYSFGFMDAGRRAMVSKDAAQAATLESDPAATLVAAWKKADEEIRKHVQKKFPLGSRVEVNVQYKKGLGKVWAYPEWWPDSITVQFDNGDTWYYPVTSVRRVE